LKSFESDVTNLQEGDEGTDEEGVEESQEVDREESEELKSTKGILREKIKSMVDVAKVSLFTFLCFVIFFKEYPAFY